MDGGGIRPVAEKSRDVLEYLVRVLRIVRKRGCEAGIK
jgi:acetolactate synthase regulatory subunit